MTKNLVQQTGYLISLIILLMVMLSYPKVQAQERLEMEGTSVIGNKELPKVLYIVPWKSPEPLALTAPEINSVMDEVATPVNRSGFRRQIQFHKGMYPPADIQ